MTILLTELRQESNSLSPFTSGLDYFSSGWVLDPDQARDELPLKDCAVAGMQEVLEAAGHDVAFGPAFYSQSGGTAEHLVVEAYLEKLLPLLAATPHLEGIFFSFHGALQTTQADDAEAEVLRRVRDVVGENVVIAASTDSHGYISRDLITRLDVLTGYHTYPHVDFMETGRRAARLGLAAIQDRTRVVTAWAPVPMMVSASGYSTVEGPYRDLIAHGTNLVRSGRIADFSIYHMQPWLDVAEPTSAVVVVADNAQAAKSCAEELASRLYHHRHDFEPELSRVPEVLDRLAHCELTTPVIIVDSADSPNAGAAADSMFVPREALNRRTQGPPITLLSVVVDTPGVEAAFDGGVGARIELSLGATIDTGAPSLRAVWEVRSLHDGHFRNEHVGSAGAESYLGRTAVVSTSSGAAVVTMVVCEHLVSPGDPRLYRGMGLEPTHFDAVVVKANTSFKAAYRSFAGDVVMADTPGAAPPNIMRAPFVRLPRTLYPWVDEEFEPRAEIMRTGPAPAADAGETENEEAGSS